MKKTKPFFSEEQMTVIPETTYYLLDTLNYCIKTVSVTGFSKNYILVNGKLIDKESGAHSYFSSKDEVKEAALTYTNYQIPEHKRMTEIMVKLQKQANNLTE